MISLLLIITHSRKLTAKLGASLGFVEGRYDGCLLGYDDG